MNDNNNRHDDTTLVEYSFLWDGSEEGWALVDRGESNMPVADRYSVFNQLMKQSLIIEEDEIYTLVIESMLERNVVVLSRDEFRDLVK